VRICGGKRGAAVLREGTGRLPPEKNAEKTKAVVKEKKSYYGEFEGTAMKGRGGLGEGKKGTRAAGREGHGL